MDQADNRFYREPPADDGGFAFPTLIKEGDLAYSTGGVTVRDYFAAKALPTLLSSFSDDTECNDIDIAGMAYDIADAMLRKRSDPECPSPYRLREVLIQIANGATGYLDNDTTLANIAKRALGMEVDE
jgi:hypothetical protein